MIKTNNVWLIRNPVAGWNSNRLVDEMLKLLNEKGLNPVIQNTNAAGHAEELAAEACREKVDLLIVAGGDGTLNEVVNGLATCQKEGCPLPLLAIFPSGTVNLVAKELDIPSNPENYVDLLFKGNIKTIWPASINERYFIATVGIGFDAYIVGKINLEAKKIFSKLAYMFQTFHLLTTKWTQRYQVQIDGDPHSAVSVIVTNSYYYANHYSITPIARLTEPLFYVCLFEKSSNWDIFTYLISLVLGQLHRHKHVKIIPGKEVRIKAVQQQVQIDGDISALSCLTIKAGDVPIEVISN
ncbi:MAG: diacylglycerol kinase family lipid kinase [Pelosinus sp.]|nr:diacylglycerol kinase family lipid kinase [Pelosinus sp.]